jgi:hypothetical protein
MYQKEENIELKKKLSIFVALILNASFIFSQISKQFNESMGNNVLLYKIIIFFNYVCCFLNTFIVFFNKKKYQIIHAKLEDESIKKRIIIDVNEYIPNWATTYWGVIFYPFYNHFFKEHKEKYQVSENQITENNIKGNSKKNINKYMYIKVWDPPYFSLNLFCCFSPPQLIYISQVKQNNWYFYAIISFLISAMFEIIVDLYIGLVGDKDLINREVFKEYNEKFVYNRLCIPKFNKCVGTDTDFPEDDQEQLSFYDFNQMNNNIKLNNYNNFEVDRYSHFPTGDDYNYSDSFLKLPRSDLSHDFNKYRDDYRGIYNTKISNKFINDYQNSYKNDYYFRSNIYKRNSYQHNPNESMSIHSYGNRSYLRGEPLPRMNSIDRNSYNLYNKYSSIKSVKSNPQYIINPHSSSLLNEKTDSIATKTLDMDENGEFVVTTNNTNNKMDYDENGYFLSSLDIESQKESSNKEKINIKNQSYSPIPSLNTTSSTISTTLYNSSNDKIKKNKGNLSFSDHSKFVITPINQSNNNNSQMDKSNSYTSNSKIDKRNLSFSDRSKFVIIDKNNTSMRSNKSYKDHENTSHNTSFSNYFKKFKFINKKEKNKSSNPISNNKT